MKFIIKSLYIYHLPKELMCNSPLDVLDKGVNQLGFKPSRIPDAQIIINVKYSPIPIYRVK